jgi:hypothetical protein
MKAQPAAAGNDLVANIRAFVMRQTPVVRADALDRRRPHPVDDAR